RQGLMTLYQQKTSADERRRTVSAALTLVFTASLIIGGLLLAFPVAINQFAHSLSIDVVALRLVLLAILLQPFPLFPLALAQPRVESEQVVAEGVCARGSAL